MVLMALCMVQVLQAIETLASAAPTGEDVAAVRALQDSARAAIDKLASEAPENVELWAKLAAAALRGGLHGPAVRAARGALELPADRRSESLAQAASTFAAGEQLPPPPPIPILTRELVHRVASCAAWAAAGAAVLASVVAADVGTLLVAPLARLAMPMQLDVAWWCVMADLPQGQWRPAPVDALSPTALHADLHCQGVAGGTACMPGCR